MSSFAADIQIVCLGSLSLLIVYTLWLSRYRGLDGHLTVRWLLLLGAALLTILFWRYLPFFSVTSNLQERELLLMVTVLLFGFVVFLMLDLLVRSSRQSAQIKRLTQELAIQRERIDRLAPNDAAADDALDALPSALPRRRGHSLSMVSILACLWIAVCVAFYVVEGLGFNSSSYPPFLKASLSAGYLE